MYQEFRGKWPIDLAEARYPQTHLRETGNGPVDARWIEIESRADRTHSAIVAVTQQLE